MLLHLTAKSLGKKVHKICRRHLRKPERSLPADHGNNSSAWRYWATVVPSFAQAGRAEESDVP